MLKTTLWIVLVAGASALLGGCSNIHATGMRMGRFYPSLSANCPVTFENLTYQEANARYEQIGLVSLSGTSDQPQAWEGETRERLWPKVCEMGGTVVTANAMMGGQSTLGGGTGMIQFAVWHERPAGAPPPAMPAAQ